MYEFLAPWGALLPLVSAVISYSIVAEFRRRKLLKHIQGPVIDDERSFSAG